MENNIRISLLDLVKHDDYGINAMLNHANSYMQGPPSLFITTYEKLQFDPYNELRSILVFLGVSACNDVVASSVHNSSFDKMRNIELSKGRKYGNSDFLFTRSGIIGEGIKEIEKDEAIATYVKGGISKSPILQLLYG